MLVKVWTDGGCAPNPGPGGWGVVLTCGKHRRELSGSKSRSTNNEMELMAVNAAIKALKFPCNVVIHTDSQNVIGWLSLGWKCRHEHLREQLAQFRHLVSYGEHEVRFVKVKAHSGDTNNERADRLAVMAREELK